MKRQAASRASCPRWVARLSRQRGEALNRRRRRGFTLLEVLLVVGILVALAAIALPNLIGVQQGAQIDTAKLQVKTLEGAFKLYQSTTGSFPPTNQGVASLLAPPNPAPDNWRGPYLDATTDLKDPWGMQYNYEFPGKHNSTIREMPDIWSNGPDRQSGTADDIGNWATTSG